MFTLQGDEDLVSEFVANEGLGCLLDVGQKCDQTCQQYILKGEHHIQVSWTESQINIFCCVKTESDKQLFM